MDNGTEVVYLYLDDIIPNRFQPREVFDEQALKELAVSIKEHGVIQPIIVRKVDNKYEIIAGERRYKASTMAGLTKIPAIVKNLDDKESSKVALIENLQRKDLSPIEEARTYQKILELEDGMTQEELAASVGKTQSSVSNKIRLLALPDEVQDALLNNKISERHARCLLRIENPDEQVKMLSRITEEKLTVRELDKIIKEKDNPVQEEEKEEVISDNEEENDAPEEIKLEVPSIPIAIASEPEVQNSEPEEDSKEEQEEVTSEQTTEETSKEEIVEEDESTEEKVESVEEIRDMTEESNKNTFDISNIANPFARKEVDEPMDQNTNNVQSPAVSGLNINLSQSAQAPAPMQMQPQMVPQSPMQPQQQMPGQMQPQMVPQITQQQMPVQQPVQQPVQAPAPIQSQVVPQSLIQAQKPAPAPMPMNQPVPANMSNNMVSAPAGGIDSKSITESINKMVEEYKKKGANIDFRSYNIGTVTSISITIR